MKKIFTAFFIITLQSFAQNQFVTLFERSGFVSTDNYANTLKYFESLAEYSEYAELRDFGKSPQGRRLVYLIVDRDKNFEPDTEVRSKPLIFIQNGIHSGEIEGKDASMILLREILVTKEKFELIEKCRIIVIPVYNVDGHERKSAYNRINQNGPKEMGWRTTALNYNLNRDYTKADTPEMKALLVLLNKFDPDIFIDTHTTDGADYQYVITYGIDVHLLKYEPQRKLVREKLNPFIEKSVYDDGFMIFPYVGFIDGDFRNGLKDWISSPRYSHGYAAIRNRIGVLIETHMLKPYKQRVFSTKSLLEAIIKFANLNGKSVVEISDSADRFTTEYFKEHSYPLGMKITDRADTVVYKGKQIYMDSSFIAGAKIKKYKQEPLNLRVPYYRYSETTTRVELPNYYVLPKEFSEIAELIKLHGIEMDTIKVDTMVEAVVTKFSDVSFSHFPYEGHFSPKFKFNERKLRLKLSEGDFLIDPHQPAGGLIAYLLEPKSRDSFLKWGFFNNIFEQKEYFEAYSMDPIAKKMYEENEDLRKEFESRLKSDSVFAANARARLNFFYERSPYFDKKLNVYPIIKIY